MSIDAEMFEPELIGSIPTSNALQNSNTSSSPMIRPRVEMDGVAAAWLLFQFSRQSKDQKASHTIRTLLPNGALKVVNIEVECMAYKEATDGSQQPLGLPGAFAQDIFISLMDHLVNQVKSTHEDLIARARTIGLKGVSLPPSCTEVYFRNKDLARTMGMEEKNARITTALQHLHKTHIKIRGCIYRDGKEETVEHDTYYIPSLTAGKRIRGGMDRTEWQRAKFDDVLVKEILHGYIAQMDTDKLLKLPSGAPRKLYSLLSAKILERQGAERIVVTNDEIIGTLRIQKAAYRKLAKRYFQDLIEAGIVSSFCFENHKGVDVVVFTIPPEQAKQQLHSPQNSVDQFFEMLRRVSEKDSKLQAVLNDPKYCDLDAGNLTVFLRQYDQPVQHKDKFYPKALLWADMLIHNKAQGQPIKSVVALLKALLKKGEEPTVLAGFVPVELRLEKILAKVEAEKSVEKAQELTLMEDARIKEMAERSFKNYNNTQKDRMYNAIREVMLGGREDSVWVPSQQFLEQKALDLLISAINHGFPTGDLSAILKWYLLENRHHAQNKTGDSSQQALPFGSKGSS